MLYYFAQGCHLKVNRLILIAAANDCKVMRGVSSRKVRRCETISSGRRSVNIRYASRPNSAASDNGESFLCAGCPLSTFVQNPAKSVNYNTLY